MFSSSVFAQNNAAKADDFGRIVLTAHLDPEKSHVPSDAARILQNKLNQIVTRGGMGGSIMQRFIITANVNILTQDITPTAPPMHAYTLEITFYIGDGIDGTLFSSTSITSKGVGETEDKAFIAALKSIKANDAAFTALINKGKNRILEYYNSQCDLILSKAKSMAGMHQYNDALYTVMSIPDVCEECYDKAMAEAVLLYQSQIDYESVRLLDEARNVWQSGLDANAADKAGKLLTQINPRSCRYGDALKLSKDIGKWMKELDDREWQYVLQEQANAHTQEMATIQANKEIAAMEVGKQKALIDACRDVAMEAVRNQPAIVYSYYWW